MSTEVRAASATVALTETTTDGYTRDMAIPDGLERITVDLPAELVARMDELKSADGISRQARVRLILQVALDDDSVLTEVIRRSRQEREDAPPRIDPRRG